jgi:hypothetical protein
MPDTVKSMVNSVIEGFSYSNVALRNSLWERQRRDTIELFLGLDNDDLLLPFRKEAGLPSEAEGLHGWYGRFPTTFGQWLGAFAKLYKVSGDYRLKEKALYLADEWGVCAAASPKTAGFCDTYFYDKMMGGFLDMYEYLDYDKAPGYISILTDSAIKRFRRDIKRDGVQDAGLHGMIEWYTLPEQLYRAYQITGDKKYFDFAREWDYTYYWNKLSVKDFKIGPRHAYSHVNALSSAARAYQNTGDEKYLLAMKNAYDELLANHTFVTGGYGPAECLYAAVDGYLGNSIMDVWDKGCQIEYTSFWGGKTARSDVWGSCEVSCCAWAVFKFCDYMIKLTGEAKYGHWVENILYNGLGGQIPMTKNGKVMYYAGYFINGAVKSVEDRRLQDGGAVNEWQCCTGTFPQDTAEYCNLLYYHDNTGLYVSQYLPSKVDFDINGKNVSLENYSLFPEEKDLRFRVSLSGQEQFSVYFRRPFWASGENRCRINGRTMQVTINDRDWFEILRLWKDGDIIEISYEFKLSFVPVDRFHRDIAALRYGPLVLASDSMALLKGDIEKPETWIHPDSSEYAAFKTDPGHTGYYDSVTTRFRPYYLIPAMEWYYMYFRIESGTAKNDR